MSPLIERSRQTLGADWWGQTVRWNGVPFGIENLAEKTLKPLKNHYFLSFLLAITGESTTFSEAAIVCGNHIKLCWNSRKRTQRCTDGFVGEGLLHFTHRFVEILAISGWNKNMLECSKANNERSPFFTSLGFTMAPYSPQTAREWDTLITLLLGLCT